MKLRNLALVSVLVLLLPACASVDNAKAPGIISGPVSGAGLGVTCLGKEGMNKDNHPAVRVGSALLVPPVGALGLAAGAVLGAAADVNRFFRNEPLPTDPPNTVGEMKRMANCK